MRYFEHLLKNWNAAIRCIVLAAFHFLHGIIPCKFTSHEYWGICRQIPTDELLQTVFAISTQPIEPFEPFSFYNRDGDCFEFFVTNENYYGERLDNYLTLYLNDDTEEIVGFCIKNINRIIEKMVFLSTDETVHLDHVIATILSMTKDDQFIDDYRRVVDIAKSNDLTTLPQLNNDEHFIHRGRSRSN